MGPNQITARINQRSLCTGEVVKQLAYARSLTRSELLRRTPCALRTHTRASEAQMSSFLQACLMGAQGVGTSRSGP
jgi:hypothetical protein